MMWKVILSLEVESSIEDYINAYKKYFINLYTGGGIWSEESLIETYIRSANVLQENIYDHISERGSSDLLPYELLINGRKKSVIFVHERIIFFEYFEDYEVKTRLIEKIFITHK